MEPDSPQLLNAQAALLERSGSFDKSIALMKQIVERFPHYAMTRINLARAAMNTRRLDEAHEWLDPVLSAERLTSVEFCFLCAAKIDLCALEENFTAARMWFDMWARFAPEDPKLEWYKSQLW